MRAVLADHYLIERLGDWSLTYRVLLAGDLNYFEMNIADAEECNLDPHVRQHAHLLGNRFLTKT